MGANCILKARGSVPMGESRPQPMSTGPRNADHSLARQNIELLAKLEHESLTHRSRAERLSDAIAGFAGSLTFVGIHVVWFATWFTVNTGHMPGVRPFDPFPFILLSVAVSCEAVLLSTFVLIKQNRMSRRAEQREHLTLQISLLSEREVTELLRLQQMICERLGIQAENADLAELAQDTAVESLARELEEKMPS
jgi:uncharacterized membrane protein